MGSVELKPRTSSSHPGPVLAWSLTVMILVVSVLLFGMETLWESPISLSGQIAISALLLTGAGSVIYLAVSRLLALISDQRGLFTRIEQAEQISARAYRRLGSVLLISQKFVEASEETEIINLLLRSVIELTGAHAVAYVPLDERGQPMAANYSGEIPFPVPIDWLEYLASPAVRDRCKTCDKGFSFDATCPLLKGPFAEYRGLYCMLLRRNEHDFGILNLYLPESESVDEETQSFLRTLIDETALALEGLRLRSRELAALQHLHTVRQKNDSSSLLAALLENVRQTLEADFALLLMEKTGEFALVRLSPDGASGSGFEFQLSGIPAAETLVSGELPASAHAYVTAILQRLLSSGQSFISDEPPSTVQPSPIAARSLLAVLLAPEGDLPPGALMVGSARPRAYTHRQLALLQTLASQAALVLQNQRQMANLEYQAMIDERTRLAREIHDGLAQTLGFLKLQMAQMQGYLERDELDRLGKSMRSSYLTLSEAYQDARYAIDGLRIFPSGASLASWLNQIVADFREGVAGEGTQVYAEGLDVHTQLPPEIQAQLIRILQEALSNIRKHAHPRNVWITWCDRPGEVSLEIRDDGLGFDDADVSGPSQHGLQGMRERAELVGAVFQVSSLPQQGTTIRVLLPLKAAEVAV